MGELSTKVGVVRCSLMRTIPTMIGGNNGLCNQLRGRGRKRPIVESHRDLTWSCDGEGLKTYTTKDRESKRSLEMSV